MPALRDLRFTLSCRGSEKELFRSLLDTELTTRTPDGRPLGSPTDIQVQGRKFSDMDAFYAAWDEESRPSSRVAWSGRKLGLEGEHRYWSCFVAADEGYVKIANTAVPVTTEFVLQLLRTRPFDVAGVSRLDEGWPDSDEGPWFGFSEGHYLHGFACGFKGTEGHARLVHRRWLERGPWRLIRDESRDLSFVQFHALDASVPEAVAQAAPGHERMGQSAMGGFISRHTEFGGLQLSLHDPASATSIVVVPAGRHVATHEMFEAAAVKALQPYPDLRVEQVAFVFTSEDDARAQLHDLWLYGLEVRAITATGEVRLDDAYEPPTPEAPDWVKQERDIDGLG